MKRKLPDLIFEGVRRLKVNEILHRGLKSNNEVIRLARDFEKRVAEISLKPDEAFILSRLDSATRISDVLLVSPLGLEVTQKILLGFLVTDVIEFVAATADKRQESSQGATANRTRLDPQINGENAQSILNEESDQVRADVFSMLDRAKNHNYYDLLDVGPTAVMDEIKKSYYSLAKKYHPDCYHQSTSQDFKEALDTIFSILSQAYETLKVPATRSSYDAKIFRLESSPSVTEKAGTPASTSSTPHQKLADLNYRQGRGYFDQKDYWSAIQAFRQAVRMEPENPRYRYWLGAALSKNAKWRREAEEHFLKAIQLEQFTPDAYVGLGLLYQEAGMHKRAENQFKQALQVSPDNKTAQDALNILLGAGAKKAKGLDSLKSLF